MAKKKCGTKGTMKKKAAKKITRNDKDLLFGFKTDKSGRKRAKK